MANWQTQIPTIRDKQGNLWYNCDIGMRVDSVGVIDLSDVDELRVTGNMYLGNDASLPSKLISMNAVIIGDNAYGGRITADLIAIGNDAEFDGSLVSASSILIGNDFKGQDIVALDGVRIGHHSSISSVFCGLDISIYNRATISGDLHSIFGSITLSNHSKLAGNITALGYIPPASSNITVCADISIENHCEIDGNVISNQGSIGIRDASCIMGEVTTSGSGTVAIGDFVELGGNVTVEDGNIVLTNYVDATNLFAANGSISCGHHLKANTISTNKSATLINPICSISRIDAAGGMFLKN